MTRRLVYVAGTDTGVGKTTISRGLLARWRMHARVAGFKPAETGCATGPDGALVPEDAVRLAHAAGTSTPLDLVCPFRYELPAAPAAAAARQGHPFSLAIAKAALERLDADVILVEGAGGVLVPFTEGLLGVDVAKGLGCTHALVVGRAALGTINHTLLTILELRRRGLTPLGVVLVQQDTTAHAAASSDAPLIEKHGGVLVLGTVPPLTAAQLADDASIAATLAATLDLSPIEKALQVGA
jgi:dethiobiotin synthetase